MQAIQIGSRGGLVWGDASTRPAPLVIHEIAAGAYLGQNSGVTMPT